MPYRAVVSGELAKLFGVLSHPIRIRIVEELQREDLSVGALKDILGITHAAVSQQLSVLRSHHLVVENRQGRNVFYHLRNPLLAKWIMEGLGFIMPDALEVKNMRSAIKNVQTVWGSELKPKAPAKKTTTPKLRSK
jgi:DNA-binding transcriptional ArsR family regulator